MPIENACTVAMMLNLLFKIMEQFADTNRLIDMVQCDRDAQERLTLESCDFLRNFCRKFLFFMFCSNFQSSEIRAAPKRKLDGPDSIQDVT